MSPLRIIYAGTPEFAVPALQALLDAGHELVAVYTQPDRPAGRGRQLAASAVKQRALEAGLHVEQPQTLRDPAAVQRLQAWQADAMVVAAYGLILPPAVLAAPRLGCINIHASLLPRWRGAAPIQRAILAGDEHTGITIMRMDAGLDTGPMLLERSVAIGADESAASLHDRLALLGAQALLDALPGIADGTLPPRPQPVSGVTHAAKIRKEEAGIDWWLPAQHIARQVRAFNPWPVAETYWNGRQMRVWQAHVIEAEPKAAIPDWIREPASPAGEARHPGLDPGAEGRHPGLDPGAEGCHPGLDPGAEGRHPGLDPGRVVAVGERGLSVATGAGWLALERLQLAGGKVLAAADFLNAHRILGATLGGAGS